MKKTVVVLAAVVLVLAGCAHRERAAEPSTTPVPTSSMSSATSPARPTPPSSTAVPDAPVNPVLRDGRHAAFLTGIDMRARTVTFDVVQFLTGHAADEAYHRDHPEVEGGVPNGIYIVNENPRLRTLPVRHGVDVEVVWLGAGAEPEHISFEELPGYFAHDVVPDDYRLWYDPFWLTVRDDRVEAITEQYLP